VLPKNPQLADFLISCALRLHGWEEALAPLNDERAFRAHAEAVARARAQRRSFVFVLPFRRP
jgi:CobQ-like glutamine amidotransferase family enzyme